MTSEMERTVGQLVAQRPSLSRVFEKHGIDYCCGGGRSLAEAGRAAGIDLEALLREIAVEPEVPGDRDWTRASIAETIRWILAEHHDWLKRELPRISSLAAKVAGVHGQGHPEMVDLAALVEAIRDEIEPHLQKEERILFPAALQLEESGTIGLSCHGGVASLESPISVMESDHEALGRLLDRLAELTEGFEPPAHACNTWRAFYAALKELDGNTHRHVHLENEVLHPAIRAREAKAAAALAN
jgi:regulator of cell morphogenesis and NO signaling